jgi:hypothetical protein
MVLKMNIILFLFIHLLNLYLNHLIILFIGKYVLLVCGNLVRLILYPLLINLENLICTSISTQNLVGMSLDASILLLLILGLSNENIGMCLKLIKMLLVASGLTSETEMIVLTCNKIHINKSN